MSSADRYRTLAGSEPLPGEQVLEVGCSTGETTRILARSASAVVAVDVSASLVVGLQNSLDGADNVLVAVADGRDTAELVRLLPDPQVLFMDIGGNALLPNVVSVLRGLLRAFTPRLAVVRSEELASFVGSIDSVELPGDWERAKSGEFASLDDLSRSYLAVDRAFAARKLAGLGTAEALARLAEMVDDNDRRVRWSAQRALEP